MMASLQKVLSRPSDITLASANQRDTSLEKQRTPSSPSASTGGVWNAFVRAVTGEGSSGEDRSTSRGRDLASTGRGGVGNVVRSESANGTRVVRAEDGDERGREVFNTSDRVTHAGRGGQGNVRSPSRDANKVVEDRLYEEAIIRKRRQERENQPVSAGRGGTGNISRDPSRSRSRVRDSHPPAYETGVGRGGAGNIDEAKHFRHLGQGELETIDDDERIEAIRHEKRDHTGPHAHFGNLLHSTGRGGGGNITSEASNQPNSTNVAPPAPGIVGHGGRGGAGNIEAVV
ncbi:hypothetical protein FRB94_002538 [Tulasnella sp. JGI-2019a]|nr:hypothetical protein FRB94_002538 [Tulasnella sp. JGI-2019a]